MIKTRSEQFKNLLEILIIATLVIVAFFWTTKSYASGTPFINSTNLTNPPFNFAICGTCGGGGFENTVKQGYTPSSTVDLCTIILPVKKIGNPGNLELLIRASSTGSAGGGGGDQATSTSIVFWDMASSSFTTSYATYNLNIFPCISLTANTFYNFITYQTDHNSNTSNRYDIGEDLSANVTSTQGTLTDAYTTIAGNVYSLNSGLRQTIRVYSIAQLAASIDFTFPINGTTTGEFTNWNVIASGEIGSIKINYSGNFSSFQDSYSPNVSVANSAGFSIIKNHSLGSTSTIWFATALLYDSTGALTAQSSQIIFTFNPSLTPSNTYQQLQQYLQSIYTGTASLTLPFNDASSTLQNCNSLNFFSWGTCFVNGTKAVAFFLFSPSQNTADQLKNSLISFTTVFPFTIPMTIIQEINNQASTTPASATLAINIPGLNNMTVNILTPTSTETAVGTTAKNAYFTAARLLMYLLTGAHMFFVIF